jgi:hypothetical protein
VHCPESAYRKTLLCECVSAYLPIDDNQRAEFEALLRNHPDPGVQVMSMGLLDHVELRGEQRGKLKGIEIGASTPPARRSRGGGSLSEFAVAAGQRNGNCRSSAGPGSGMMES